MLVGVFPAVAPLNIMRLGFAGERRDPEAAGDFQRARHRRPHSPRAARRRLPSHRGRRDAAAQSAHLRPGRHPSRAVSSAAQGCHRSHHSPRCISSEETSELLMKTLFADFKISSCCSRPSSRCCFVTSTRWRCRAGAQAPFAGKANGSLDLRPGRDRLRLRPSVAQNFSGARYFSAAPSCRGAPATIR